MLSFGEKISSSVPRHFLRADLQCCTERGIERARDGGVDGECIPIVKLHIRDEGAQARKRHFCGWSPCSYESQV